MRWKYVHLRLRFTPASACGLMIDQAPAHVATDDPGAVTCPKCRGAAGMNEDPPETEETLP